MKITEQIIFSHDSFCNYAKTIAKNGCRPRSFRAVQHHIENYCSGFVSEAGTIVAGEMREGVFYTSHFAPTNRKDGLKTIKAILESDIVVVFPVLSNMSSMLERIGYFHVGEVEVSYPKLQVKQLVANIQKQFLELLNVEHVITFDMQADKYEALACQAGYEY